MKKFKFFVITDPHYFAKSLGAYGEEYERFMDFEQKCYAETPYINDAVLEYLANSTESDTILIAGDLSFNGEKESHKEYSAKLRELKEKGKRIFVVTAGHDIEPNPFSYPGKERTYVEGIKFQDLLGYYGDFGYNDALSLNKEHLSYTAELNEDIRLLVICNDTAEGKNNAYDDEFLEWMAAQAKKAREDGKMMIAMEHYPVLAGQPILELVPDARQKESRKLINTLADNGVHIIFTGHMHNQSINVTKSDNGNIFYDICTGSLIGCPAFMRLVTVEDEETVKIESIPVPEYEWDKNGLSGEQHLKNQFDKMILSLVYGMKDNPARILGKFGAGDKKSLYKPFAIIGNFLSTCKIKTICGLLLTKSEPEIKNEKLIDFVVELVRSVFCGDQPFTEDDPYGKTFLRVLCRLNPVFRILNKKLRGSQGEAVDLYELLKHSAGNYGISDNNATIKLK